MLQTLNTLIFLFFSSVIVSQNVTHVSITVRDLETSIAFYSQVLDFRLENIYKLENKTTSLLFGINDSLITVNIAKLSVGNQSIELMQFESSGAGEIIPKDSKSNDLWFQHIAIVVSDMDKAYQKLRDYNVVHVSTFPQTLPDYIPAAAGIKAFYFRDPDGHNLELISYPEGKGNPDWQNKKNLFLGIDHTAIGVANTQKSKIFYNLLGMTVAGHSENFGTEQEHLNQVFGARLWITALIGNAGFGVEFLEYIAPPGGRPYPLDIDPSDLLHWHTAILVDDATGMMETLKKHKYPLISEDFIHVEKSEKELLSGFLVRDTDHHAIFIYQKN